MTQKVVYIPRTCLNFVSIVLSFVIERSTSTSK